MSKNQTREKVSFTATKKVSKKGKISFTTKEGEEVSFKATKKVPKKVKVEFYAKRKKK